MKYRVHLNNSDYQGYILLQKKTLFWWTTIYESSIYLNGQEKAIQDVQRIKKMLEETT